MGSLSDFLYMIDDFMWGSWMTILILATGIILSICFRFRYQRKIAFNFRNTFAKMLSPGEGEGTVSGFRAVHDLRFLWYGKGLGTGRAVIQPDSEPIPARLNRVRI